ncbi:GntR family transcriptional regulator [Aureimonas fodinaquatilis]|uniref:GntR family transcriptional regulator n=1 Tax=Aureimonas fodinaquatilis TaxID=2565783 RepID=A0A5B0DRQ1_9HYPH|nr:GntR family transcriptional regulator [Aureimonas fodinaquatilis]KAA0969477.1 GntR family transcriptional regulator [Aureimonas fodinaquatilis]
MSQNPLSNIVEPIAKTISLGEVTYDRLKDIIIRGAFPPNKKLTVRSVADALGVSTTPARDAINRLLSEGALVNAGPKTVVIPVLTKEVLEEVTATRLALEGLAAERAVANISDKDIASLARLQEVINRSLDKNDYPEVLAANREFHFLLYRRSNWARLVSLIESLWLQVGPSLNVLYPEFAVNRRGVSNHMDILDGLRERDAQKVRRAVEQDLRDGYARLERFLEEYDAEQ